MFKTLRHHIFRSPYQSMAAVMVVSLSLFLISVFFLLGAGSHEILRYFESRPQVSAFLKDEAKPQEIELLKVKIQAIGKVKKIDYISKEEALNIYRQQNKDKPLLLEMVTAKILPASLEVSTYDLLSLKEIAEILKKEPIIEDVIFQEDVITSLAKWTQIIREAGIGVAGFLFFIAIITVLVIVGMKISQHKEEIEILKLLGATNWYITLPFYLEGVIYGVVAALASWGLAYLTVLYFSPMLAAFLSGVPLLPISVIFMLKELAGLIGLGIIIGFFGSFLAVSRFIRTIR